MADEKTKLSLPEPIEILGVKMHPWTMDQTISAIDFRLTESQFTQHVVVNVAKIVGMRANADLNAAVTGCDIINIDGAGVVFAGRFLGYKVPERVAGIDLFERLLEYSEANSRGVYLLGARPAVLEAAIGKLRTSLPRLKIAGYHHGYFWDNEEKIVSEIKKSGADLLFVGISSPLKEEFINNWSGKLGVKFAMGVGGTFDIISGQVRRAPRWMQKTGLEWFYRVLQEPRRMWKRYLVTNSKFLLMVLKEKVRIMRSRATIDS